MPELIKFPLKLDESSQDDINVLDADGNVVAKMTWKSEQSHVMRQKQVGNAIIFALTQCFSDKEPLHDNFCAQETKVESNGNGDMFSFLEGKELSYADTKKVKKLKMFVDRLESKYK